MKLDSNQSDQIFHLGTVMVKVIVIFLFGALAVALGFIWYQSELEISENMNGSTALAPTVITVPSITEESTPATAEPFGTEVTGLTVSEVILENNQIVVDNPGFGLTPVLVSPETRIVKVITTDEGEEETDIDLSDIEVGSEVEIVGLGLTGRPTDIGQAQEIIVR